MSLILHKRQLLTLHPWLLRVTIYSADITYIFWLITTDNTALIYINCNKSAFHSALWIKIGIMNEQMNELINCQALIIPNALRPLTGPLCLINHILSHGGSVPLMKFIECPQIQTSNILFVQKEGTQTMMSKCGQSFHLHKTWDEVYSCSALPK